MKFHNTIIAQTTPIGNGGIGIIRISGNKSAKISKIIIGKIPKIRYATFCKFINKNKIIIDYGIAIYYKSPKSYTGEDVLELHCHGGQKIIEIIIKEILNLNIKNIRLAKPGEYTKRAFLNQKLDLIQAESINNIINSNSIEQINLSLISLKGKFSKILKKNIKFIKHINIIIMKEINFSEKSFSYKKFKYINKYIKKIYNNIKKLYKINKFNNINKDGIKITIIGEPNVGKSSLMNKLTNKENSIVTNIPGTTRDIIKDYININNINIEILDTTGIRKTNNIIEKIGIKKTIKEIKNSKIIILISDAKITLKDKIINNYKKIIKYINKKQILILIRNKIDLTNEKCKKFKINNFNIINISIKKNLGLKILIKLIKKKIKYINNTENKFYCNERHYYLIKKTKKKIKNIKKMIKNINKKNIKNINLDIISYQLLNSQKLLNSILGIKKSISNNVINNIFKNFCIGK